MPVKESFVDTDGNELEFYINKNGDLYMSIFKEDEPQESMYAGMITLKRKDVKKLIKKLKELEPEISEE